MLIYKLEGSKEESITKWNIYVNDKQKLKQQRATINVTWSVEKL